jgi:SAM-dependent methyltransferase
MGTSGGAAAWADVPDEQISDLIAAAEAQGLDQALQLYETRAPFFVKRLRNSALGNWHVLLARSRESRVLDVGCGFGALLAGLRSVYRRALGIDMLRNRLRVAALREACSPSLLALASGHAIPFASGSFDLVTLNGVLEWAAYYRGGQPRDLQLGMLREVRRVAAVEGTVAVAIENRFALETLMGLTDTHTGLMAVPFLPRRVASLWSRARGRGSYRTYLYSRAGYQSLLREAGWGTAKVLDLAPSYNDYDFVIDTTDSATYSLLCSQRLLRGFVPGTETARQRLAGMRPGLLGSLSYAYLVLGGADKCVLDRGHALWSTLADAGFDSGEGRFAADVPQPGVIAVVVHSRGHITGLVFMAREAVAMPAPIRSDRLNAHLRGRLQFVTEFGFADYHVSAYRAQR